MNNNNNLTPTLETLKNIIKSINLIIIISRNSIASLLNISTSLLNISTSLLNIIIDLINFTS